MIASQKVSYFYIYVTNTNSLVVIFLFYIANKHLINALSFFSLASLICVSLLSGSYDKFCW